MTMITSIRIPSHNYDHLYQLTLIMITTSTGAHTLQVQLPLPLSGTRNS